MGATEKHGTCEVSRSSLAVAALSTIVEWYDFTLYLYFATVLSRVFFGGGKTSLLATLAGFAVAYGMRPLGAMVFGHIGDRIGRQRMLMLSMMLMTLAMLATALLPDYAAIGPAAGALLLLLRCFMAFSVGGEYTGVVAYLLEGTRENHRGLVTSLASAASEIGALLAVSIAALTVGAMNTARLDAWGWRIPFFAGALLAGCVWIARSTMQESPDFLRQVQQRSVPAPSPFPHWARSPITSASPMCPRSSARPVSWPKGVRSGCPRSPRSPSSSSRHLPVRFPIALGASRCWSGWASQACCCRCRCSA
jgi:MHS family proline/betaine transporter-like MFS transporter